MVRKALCIAFLNVLSLAGCGFGEQIVSGGFKGINSNEASLIIGPEWAQSAENVDVTPGGKSVKKRPGFGLYKSAFSPSIGIHGGYHFFNSNGEDVQVWGSSVSVKGIVADGTPTTIVSSMTVGSTIDCADTQGSAYCVSSSRDFYIKTNGTTLTNWYTSPLGTMVETTVDRIAVAGVSATPNTIYHSGSNAFTTYTVGPLTTDPFTEVIASPGSKLTHLRWGCGKLLWWKDQSFGYEQFDDQYSLQIKIISDNIGTFDNTSAIDPGGSVWFRGQDGHIYRYDCSALTKESIEISPFVQSSGRRSTNLWTQTSLADFNGGLTVPAVNLSTAISVGNITVSSYTVAEYTKTSQWGNGTSSNMAVGTSSISLATNNTGTAIDPSFENSTGAGPVIYDFSTNWTVITNDAPGLWISVKTLSNGAGCTLNPQSGTYYGHASGTSCVFQIIDAAGSTGDSATVLASQTMTQTNDCVWTSYTVTSSANAGKRVKFQVKNTRTSQPNNYIVTAQSYLFGGAVSFYGNSSDNAAGHGPGGAGVDNITNGSSTITSGSFTSQTFDTGYTSTTLQAKANWTTGSSTPTFAVLHSSGITGDVTGSFATLLTSTGTNAVANRYVKYVATITITSADNSYSTYISSVNLLAKSSGTYFSVIKNAANLNSWSTFNPTKQLDNGAITFYIRASTGSFDVLSATPVWSTAQAADALVSYSTGSYFQVRADFAVTAATQSPTLNDFTVNWYEGNASDQAYGLYFDNSIWFSVSYGVGASSNTYIFKRDLINDAWTTYNFGSGGMLIQGNRLYFGSVGNGNIYQFGSGTSDNGTAISAYWRTKTFSGSDPFLENSYTQLDSYWARNANQTATVSYTLNGSTTPVSYSVGLSSTTQSLIRSKKALPGGTNGSTIDLKFSDSSDSSAWEIFLFRLMFTPSTWTPG